MIYLLGFLVLLILIVTYLLLNELNCNFSVINRIILSLSIVLFTMSIIVYPEESFNSALDGLKTWFNIVCPSLLPFFIGSELLINLGIANFIGALLEPVMRPLFNVPGCGSFPFVMSITSGYPVGSKITAELLKNKYCTKTEAQRLLSFCSTSGPLFMTGAVAIGMLNSKDSGIIIALSHYLGAITVGLCFRYYKYKDSMSSIKRKNNSVAMAFKNLLEEFEKEQKPFGALLGNAVRNSVNSILTIGGFIILFSVIIRLVILSGFTRWISDIICTCLVSFNVNTKLMESFLSGLIEMTVGSKLIAASPVIISKKIPAICAIIGWSGLSIHAQVASMISGTELSMKTYILSKMFHSITSCIYAHIIISLWGIPAVSDTITVFMYNNVIQQYNANWIYQLASNSSRFIKIIVLFIIISLLYRLLIKIYSLVNR